VDTIVTLDSESEQMTSPDAYVQAMGFRVSKTGYVQDLSESELFDFT